MIHNYLQQLLVSHCGDDWKIIPLNGCPTRFHEIEFKGWNGIIFTHDNETLNEMLTLSSQTLNVFINFYKDKYAFTEPQFCLPYDGKSCNIKIGMMELEEYDRRYGKDDDEKRNT